MNKRLLIAFALLWVSGVAWALNASLVNYSGVPVSLAYNPESASYADSGPNPNTLLRLCDSGSLDGEYAGLLYKVGNSSKLVSTPFGGPFGDLMYVNAPGSCVDLDVQVSSFRAFYPAWPVVVISDDSYVSLDDTFLNLSNATGWMNGSFTVTTSLSWSTVTVNVTAAKSQNGTDIPVDRDYLVVGIRNSSGEIMDSGITSINDSINLSRGSYTGPLDIIVNGISTSPNVISACNVSVWVDGVKTSTIAAAGRPYNLTVGVTNSTDNSSLSGARVYLAEDTGILPFALFQIIVSNVSNSGRGAVTTDANGNASLTVVPTGGDPLTAAIDNNLGNYSLRAIVEVPGSEGCSQNITLTSRSLSSSYSHVSIPSRSNIASFKDDVYRVFKSTKLWLDLGGGENHNITIYSNGTATGMGFSVMSGKPIGMNVTVLNASDDSPIPNAAIDITEFNGFLPWTLIQVVDSDVSPSGTGSVRTDANGNARFTFIATGGTEDSSIESKIGAYNITLEVFNGTARIYNSTITNSHRAIDYTPSGSAESVPNQGNIVSYKDDVYRLFKSILLWLNE